MKIVTKRVPGWLYSYVKKLKFESKTVKRRKEYICAVHQNLHKQQDMPTVKTQPI